MLNESIKKLGVTDVKLLPAKTQMKIDDYNRLVKSPIGNDKEGNPYPKKKIRLDSLVEDIILEVKLFQKQNGGKPAETVTAENVKQQHSTEKKPAATEGDPVNKDDKGALGNFLGF
jgi:hypothetical protein